MRAKWIFRVSLLFLVVVLCGASKKQKEIPYVVDFSKRFTPVDKTLYADKYEVTLKDYQLFLREKRKSGIDCSLLEPDSTLWREHFFKEDLVHTYFSSHYYADYPVCCISYYAANEFCKWLTEKYNANSKKQYKKVVFRLPTESEYKKTAFSIYDSTKAFYPWGHASLYHNGEKKLCNFWELSQEGLDFNDTTHRIQYYGISYGDIEPVASFPPNPYGLFDIVGSVSEMVQEEGVAMGGDWASTGYNVKITSKSRYEKGGSARVGFRVYMEIIEF